MGLEILIFKKRCCLQIDHTSIDRTGRDLSNDVSFAHNICSGITVWSIDFAVACT
jgi:hypothetical protein